MTGRLGRVLLWLGFAIVAVVAGVQEVQEARRKRPLETGTAAPPLIGVTRGGAPFVPGEKPQVRVITFFASWCGACAQEAPVVARLARELEPQGVRWTAVSVDEGPEREREVEEFFARLGVRAPEVVWADESALAAWKAFVLPTVYVVGRDGRIASGFAGAQPEEWLRDEVGRALSR